MITEVKNKKGNKVIKIEEHVNGFFYVSLWVNKCETCVWSGS